MLQVYRLKKNTGDLPYFFEGFFQKHFLQKAFGWMLLSHMHRKFLWNISCFFHAVHLCSASSNGIKILYWDIRLSLKRTIKITGPNPMNKHLFNIKIKNAKKLPMPLVWNLCCWLWTGFSKRENLFAIFFLFPKTYLYSRPEIYQIWRPPWTFSYKDLPLINYQSV